MLPYIMKENLRHEQRQELLYGELVFADATEGANPISGEVFEGCTGSDAVVRIAYCRVVLVPTDVTDVLYHNDRI